MDRIDIIKGDYKNSFAQTKKALDMWTKKFGVKATRRSIITAMCDIDRRLQAERIFGCDLVDHVKNSNVLPGTDQGTDKGTKTLHIIYCYSLVCHWKT